MHGACNFVGTALDYTSIGALTAAVAMVRYANNLVSGSRPESLIKGGSFIHEFEHKRGRVLTFVRLKPYF